MANSKDHIKVKALVDKEKNRVVFAESDEDFVDVLFSFMTIPMGRIVSLSKQRPTLVIGCMDNLYASVQNLDVKYFRTIECRKMLLHPLNGVPTECRLLKININDHIGVPTLYYRCGNINCYSHYETYRYCVCGNPSNMHVVHLGGERKSSDPLKAGAFLKGLSRLVILDDLQLMHQTSSSSFPFLSEYLGVMDTTSSALVAREFLIGRDEVINLLKNSLVSKEALTQTLLNRNEPYKEFRRSTYFTSKEKIGLGEARNGKIRVKLLVSKSKKRVCFAEVGEDFVDLVFSFLTIPLGHVMKQIQDGTSIAGCVDNLYKSIDDLDVEYFKSSDEKEVLLNPKIPPKFSYVNQLTGVEEASCNVYLNTIPVKNPIRLKDPKIPIAPIEDTNNQGFLVGPAMFTVTDDLSVIPISAVSGVTILNKLDIPLCDVQERVVHIGNKEAARLLVAAFGSESALTRTFLQK